MEYNRMVAYIYTYKNDSKAQNNGFAKIEVKQNILRLQVKIGCNGDDKLPYSVYLFYRNQERICGIKLGEMEQGKGEFRYVNRADNIEDSGTSFSDIRGIYICRENNYSLVYASEWDDLGFSTEKIGEPEIEEPLLETESIDTGEVSEVTDAATNAIETLISRREKVFVFSDDDLYDCVEIAPEDIEKLPNTNWSLRGNTFLNHGYYQYRHLLLGKTGLNNGCGYFIGVPGCYNRRERSTANMFGFNSFKFSMKGNVSVAQFGYWYRSLDY